MTKFTSTEIDDTMLWQWIDEPNNRSPFAVVVATVAVVPVGGVLPVVVSGIIVVVIVVVVFGGPEHVSQQSPSTFTGTIPYKQPISAMYFQLFSVAFRQ